ncbi:MAG: penicillin-binding protein 1C [Akkermansiaceae bacterium]|nr:penicillin-binding protein 1C [Akkermansiaceae bacterium]
MRLKKRFAIPLALGLAGLVGWFGLPWLVPLPDGLAENTASPVLLDRHGTPLRHLTLPDHTRRDPVKLADVPAEFIDCTLAAEDKRFFDHGGIDLLATARSARDGLTRGRRVSGASTITQQLIKLSSPPAPRNFTTKLREALAARRLEMSWSKNEILEAYLNRLNYGHNRIGPAAAARHRFGKSLDRLSLGECALLAGLPQAPTRLDPFIDLPAALARRDTVLTRLAAFGKYDDSRISRARSENPVFRPLPPRDIAPWLPALAHQGQTRTTLDAALQSALEDIVRKEIAPLRDRNVHHAAAVVIDPATGDILALVSSADWTDPRGGQINGALSPRSPGSALKPFTYLASFENSGRHPGSIVADIPTRFRTIDGLDAPENFDRRFRGPVTIREALATSLNVPAMRELSDLGGPFPLADLMRRLALIDRHDFPESDAGLGLTLGNVPVTLLDLTNAYATLARRGRHLPPRLFAETEIPDPVRWFSDRSAWLITDILADPLARAPAFGRRGPLELPFPCAVKTGTSSDFRDNWCLGFTPRFVVGVWVGNFDNSPMQGITGVAGAGPIFRATMLHLHPGDPTPWPDRPDGIIDVPIDPRNGKRLPPGSAHARMESCPTDSVPLPASNSDYDAQGRAYLDATYAEWLSSEHNHRRGDFALAPDRPAESPLRILAPRPDSIYLLDPELPNGGRLRLATNLPGLAQWQCETLTLLPTTPEPTAILSPGEHVLIVTDPRSGETQDIRIEVRNR